ncbi:MAG: hypothetical protein U0Y10_04050 [Spirosomataceae bacterium]
MDKQKAVEILSKKIDEWESRPKQDGYEYEIGLPKRELYRTNARAKFRTFSVECWGITQ